MFLYLKKFITGLILTIQEKSFRQAAGFLRIYDGKEKLDSTWIHPESYPLAKTFLRKIKMNVLDVGTTRLKTATENFIDEEEDETMKMIRSAFEKKEEDLRKGRDLILRHSILKPQDLKVNSKVDGLVMNTTSFGSFVSGWKYKLFCFSRVSLTRQFVNLSKLTVPLM